MKVERTGFLLCVAALAACPRTAEPPPVASNPTEVPVAPLETPAQADAAAEAETRDASVAEAPPLPVCSDPEVPPCADFGMPGPTCEKGMDPAADCTRLRGILRPDAARAAVTCMLERRGTCFVHAGGERSASDCFLASLSSACERPGARAECDRIVTKCGPRLAAELCIAELSAVVDEVRGRAAECLFKSCSPQCFGAIPRAKVSPPSSTAKAPPIRAAAEIAKWKHGTPLPTEWSACRLDTDCAVLPTSRCGSVAVNHLHAAFANEVLRREEAKNPPRFYPSCAGPGLPRCVAGKCS
jgi:hypothetical protein